VTTATLIRPELYCVVPRDLAESLVAPLQAHFAAHGITVIVERRDERANVPYEVRRQRALHLPRSLPELPIDLRPYAAELQLVQRMPSPGLNFADDTLHEVIDAVRDGDPIAASELVWRMHARVCTRLGSKHGNAIGLTLTDAAMGTMLDRLDEYPGHVEAEFHHWLDGVVDGR
jgi:hypothetical protein